MVGWTMLSTSGFMFISILWDVWKFYFTQESSKTIVRACACIRLIDLIDSGENQLYYSDKIKKNMKRTCFEVFDLWTFFNLFFFTPRSPSSSSYSPVFSFFFSSLLFLFKFILPSFFNFCRADITLKPTFQCLALKFLLPLLFSVSLFQRLPLFSLSLASVFKKKTSLLPE